MPSCAIYGCDNRTETIKGTNIRLHQFPVELQMRLKWMSLCKRKDEFKSSSYRICSIHFSEEDYVRDSQAKLLNLDRRPKLKSDAIPHLNLPLNIFEQNCRLDVLPAKISKLVLQEVITRRTENERRAMKRTWEEASIFPVRATCNGNVTIFGDSSSEEIDFRKLCQESTRETELLCADNERLRKELDTCLKNFENQVAAWADSSSELAKFYSEM